MDNRHSTRIARYHADGGPRRRGRLAAARRWAALLGALCLVLAPSRTLAAGPIHVVTYRIQPGDTLGGIAEFFYGDQLGAERIAEYNRIANMNRISVGQKIDIPFDDQATWEAYARRAGLPLEPPSSQGVAGGSQDVAVEGGGDSGDSQRYLAIIVYVTLAAALSVSLYVRSRRHEHTALGVGAPRR